MGHGGRAEPSSCVDRRLRWSLTGVREKSLVRKNALQTQGVRPRLQKTDISEFESSHPSQAVRRGAKVAPLDYRNIGEGTAAVESPWRLCAPAAIGHTARRIGRPYVLWVKLFRHVPARRRPCQQDTARGEARRHPSRASACEPRSFATRPAALSGLADNDTSAAQNERTPAGG
jgi:hypothetical protein